MHQNISLRWINSFSSRCWLVGRNNQSDDKVSRRMILSRENKFQKNKRWRHHNIIRTSLTRGFIRWSRREQHSMLSGCKHQFEFVELAYCNILMNIPNDIFENSIFLKYFWNNSPTQKWPKVNSLIYYLQWNRVYILCISSIYSKSTSITLFHHKWSTRDLLTL